MHSRHGVSCEAIEWPISRRLPHPARLRPAHPCTKSLQDLLDGKDTVELRFIVYCQGEHPGCRGGYDHGAIELKLQVHRRPDSHKVKSRLYAESGSYCSTYVLRVLASRMTDPVRYLLGDSDARGGMVYLHIVRTGDVPAIDRVSLHIPATCWFMDATPLLVG